MINVKEYIDSGVIEDYVLDNLSDKEAKEVEAIASKYPEVLEAIEDYRESLTLLGAVYQATPKEELKEDIWAKIEEEGDENNKVIGSLKKSGSSSSNNKTFVRYIAASFFAVTTLASITWAVILNDQLNEKQKKLAELEDKYEQSQKEIEQLKSYEIIIPEKEGETENKDLADNRSRSKPIIEETTPKDLTGDELSFYLNNKIKVDEFRWYEGPSGKVSYIDAAMQNTSEYYLKDVYAVVRYYDNDRNLITTKAKKLPFDLAPGESRILDRFMIGFEPNEPGKQKAQLFFTKGRIMSGG